MAELNGLRRIGCTDLHRHHSAVGTLDHQVDLVEGGIAVVVQAQTLAELGTPLWCGWR